MKRFAAALVLFMVIGVEPASADGRLGFSAAVRVAPAPPAPGPGVPEGAEPRVAATPDGRAFVITNGADGAVAVYRSSDEGRSWHHTAPPFVETMATPDTDIAALPSGRVVAAGLDEGAFQIVVSYSDDSGATWHESSGTRFADQDRPWLAAGPHNRVYLLFHNLFSGFVSENMFVSTSTDGGASFGAPVPLTFPGSDAWSDLQCGASSGPWGIATNPRSGRVYAAWGGRHGPGDGGCDAAVEENVGFSIEPADRLWVATSPDGTLGSWSTSIAVDDSATRRSIGTVFTPPAVDAGGIVYVAYTESPNAYPDYFGASVRYRWSSQALARWSRPVTVAAGGGAGHLTVEAVAGARGRLDLAYLSGVVQHRGAPAWFMTAAAVRNATASRPSVRTVRLSSAPSYVGTATALSGYCGTGPTAGLQQGVTCPRAADDFGVAAGIRCRLLVVWPMAAGEATAGTWASHQTSGPAMC
jgi:hypothetical protein